MIEPIWAVTGMVVPALLAAIVLALTIRPWRKSCSIHSMHLGWALAILVGFGTGYFVTLGWPHAPMVAVDYLGLVALIAVVVQLGVNLSNCPSWVVPIARSILAIALTPLLLISYIEHSWSASEIVLWLSALCLASVAIQGLMTALSHRAGRDLPVVLGVCAGAVGLANLMSAWETGGQLGLTLAAAIFGGAAIAMLMSCKIAARGVTIVVMPIYLGLLVIGHFYNSLVGWHAIVLAIAPLAAWVGEIPKLKSKSAPWVIAIVRLVCVGIILLAVLFPVVFAFIESMSDEYAY